MINPEKLEDLIREKIPYGVLDSRNFYTLKCQCCNDYKVRAGFKFDGNSIGYNCFNCGTAARYEEFSGRMSKNMRSILNAYDIDDSEISLILNSAFFKKNEEEAVITLANVTKIDTSTPTIQLPPNSFILGNGVDDLDYQVKLIRYLESRNIDLTKYDFFYSHDERFKNRVIIPCFRNGHLIFWQARSIDELENKRYDNAIVSRNAVMFNMDKLNSFDSIPLFVSEGVFDAMIFDGIATIGSKLNDAKIELFKKTNRRLIFVIDKDDNGKQLAKKVIELGWEITFTPNGTNDINHSVQRFGKIFTAVELMKNIPKSRDSSQLAISINCI